MIFSGVAMSALSGRLGEILQLFPGLRGSLVGQSLLDQHAQSAGNGETILPVFFLCYILSQIVSACSTLVKEKVFKSYEESQILREGLQEDSISPAHANSKLDIFIVNTFGSTAQMVFAALLLPLNAHLRGIPLESVPQLFLDSARAFAGSSSSVNDNGSSLFPVMYIVVNIIFNIATLTLTRASSGVLTSIAVSTSVPLSVLIFATVSLPVIGLSKQIIGPEFILGLFILMAGLVTYNIAPQLLKAQAKKKALVASARKRVE